MLQGAISLSQQVQYYKEYQNKVRGIGGKVNATLIISGAIYLVSAGSSDFVQNYYVNPLLNKVYTADQFSDILMQSYGSFIQASSQTCICIRSYILTYIDQSPCTLFQRR